MATESSSTLPPPTSTSTGVIEFSRLRIKDGFREQHKEAIHQGLAHAKKGMEDFTGNEFHIFEGVENPNHVYIVGEWASLEQHMDQWIPSEKNQDLLKLLGPFVEVDYLFHLDRRIGDIPPGTPAPVLSCGRHVMESAKRSDFESTFMKRKSCLEAHTLGSVGAGWRIEKELGREEFVLFSPWNDVSQHMGFAKTKEFSEYSEITKHILLSATEIFHLMLMKLPTPEHAS